MSNLEVVHVGVIHFKIRRSLIDIRYLKSGILPRFVYNCVLKHPLFYKFLLSFTPLFRHQLANKDPEIVIHGAAIADAKPTVATLPI
jgi:hypothetical protein